jgi:hypothetical protein
VCGGGGGALIVHECLCTHHAPPPASPLPPSSPLTLTSFSKDESLTTNATLTNPEAFAAFDFLVTESPSFHSQLFEVAFTAPGFKAMDWKRARVVTAPALFVMHAKAHPVPGPSSAPPAVPPVGAVGAS